MTELAKIEAEFEQLAIEAGLTKLELLKKLNTGDTGSLFSGFKGHALEAALDKLKKRYQQAIEETR